jgi:hypothetical protein
MVDPFDFVLQFDLFEQQKLFGFVLGTARFGFQLTVAIVLVQVFLRRRPCVFVVMMLIQDCLF